MVLLSRIMMSLSEVKPKRIKRKFMDSLRLYVKGGAGGMGYPKYGGLGGCGGDVYVLGKEGKTLKDVLSCNPTKRISGFPGENAHRRRILGQKGNDITIEAPVGITLYDSTGKKLGEINKDGEKVLIGKGGIGGCPDTGFSGTAAQGTVITFDLKLLADVGLVGFPNAGKSTILSAVSKATPKIASYPFTTIQPTIGQMMFPDYRQISMADLPGLIEGAHLNIGLGHKFLKHVERTKVILVIVDSTGFRLSMQYNARTCLETVLLLNKELELYKEELLNKPAVLVVNKMDLPQADENLKIVKDALTNFESNFMKMPENLRPNKPFIFKRILSMSAKNKDEKEISDLKNAIRDVIDETKEDDEAELKLGQELSHKLNVHGPMLI